AATYLSGGAGGCSELAGAEQAVAGVAQARQDVALRVELAVERGREDVDVRVRLEQPPHALGRGDDREEADAPGSGALEGAHRRHRRAARGQHRVEQVEV